MGPFVSIITEAEIFISCFSLYICIYTTNARRSVVPERRWQSESKAPRLDTHVLVREPPPNLNPLPNQITTEPSVLKVPLCSPESRLDKVVAADSPVVICDGDRGVFRGGRRAHLHAAAALSSLSPLSLSSPLSLLSSSPLAPLSLLSPLSTTTSWRDQG